MAAGSGDRLSAVAVRRLAVSDEPALRSLCRTDTIAHCYANSRIGTSLRSDAPTHFLGAFDGDGALRSAVYVGANLVPVGTDAAHRVALARALETLMPRPASLAGPRDEVLGLWSLLETHWGPARDVRPNQPVLVIDHAPHIDILDSVRPVQPHEIEEFLPAAIEMFTSETGMSPTANGMGPAFHARVAETIRGGRALACFSDGRVVFKAEIGAVADGVCQIQGVWVEPASRGIGIGGSGMAAVVSYALEHFAPMVSLYVNDYNETARRMYGRVGFRQHTTFATVHR